MCMYCALGEVEDVYHWMMRCPTWRESRAKLIEKVKCLIDVQDHTNEEVTDCMMDRACTTVYALISRQSNCQEKTSFRMELQDF